MANFCRELITDRQVEAFVDSILCIHDNDDKRAAINRIANAERNMRDYYKYPTLTHSDYRDFQFKIRIGWISGRELFRNYLKTQG